MIRTAIILAGLILAVGATPLLADDIYPPPWRGQPGTTMQQWKFSVDNRQPLPDLVNNPYGNPTMTIVPFPPEWYASYGDPYQRYGVYPLSGVIEIDIPNAPSPNEFKEIWIQLVWAPEAQNPNGVPGIVITAPGSQVTTNKILQETCAGVPWRYTEWEYILVPNPTTEHIKIYGDVLVDQLVIDTRCAPEPATMALLGLGGLGMLFRRKRS
jgi:hypothetical protein